MNMINHKCKASETEASKLIFLANIMINDLYIQCSEPFTNKKVSP